MRSNTFVAFLMAMAFAAVVRATATCKDQYMECKQNGGTEDYCDGLEGQCFRDEARTLWESVKAGV